MKFENLPGSTPLEVEELGALIPDLTTQGQLNEFEAQNIAKAEQWATGNARFRGELLTGTGLIRLHERMFGDTWKWAGKFRTSNKNLGMDWARIPEEVQKLCGDARYWVEHDSWPWPELAVRFHHRLVRIHPFVNGNGRHARLAANLLLAHNGKRRLPWGGASLTEQGDKRKEYIASLREADGGSLKRLVQFVQSDEAGPEMS